jgi:SARP family transcriptional regulator, regulator of embCAB operon
MRARILGPLEVESDGHNHTPKPAKLRTVLALLLINPNANVSIDAFIEELWGQSVPRSATGTLQTYIYQLRKILCDLAGDSTELLTRPSGYQLRVAPEQLDAVQFDSLVKEGRAALDRHDPALASVILHRALRLWRGRTLSGVECGTRLNAHIVRLEETRLSVLELRIAADLQIGRHRDLIGELKGLVAIHPLHEWFHARLILALHFCGRRGEALGVYQKLRRDLREELGLDPTAELQQIHRAVLIGSPPAHAQRLSLAGAAR